MLNILPSNDKRLLDELTCALCAKTFPATVGYVLYADGKAAGIAHVEVNETSTIKFVGILSAYRKKGYGDFFTRSLLFRLSAISRRIRIAYISGYYTRFGFVADGADGMIAESSDIRFDSSCGHC